MKRSRCENLRQRYKRIEIEKMKLDNFQFSAEDYQQDVVTSSMDEFPYIKTHVTVEGLGCVEYPKKKSEIYAKILSLKQEIEDVETFIDTVSTDETTRNILQCVYVIGLSQEETAEKLGYDQSTISKKIKEFWKKNEE